MCLKNLPNPGDATLEALFILKSGATGSHDISIGCGLRRFFGYIVTLGIGFMTIPFTSRNQGIQDFIAQTVVIVKPWR